MTHLVRKLDSTLGLAVEDGARIGLLIFLAAAALVGVIYQGLSITYRYQLDYGEAPLVDQALRLASGQSLYRADLAAPPYTISNYPPLYVTVLAPFVAAFGPTFLAGRLISTLCAWASALFVALIVHTHTRDRFAAVAAGSVFIAVPYVTHWSSLLRIDLQALALSLAALWVLARWPMARWSLVAAGLLLVGAIYTRQSYALAAPLAAFAWLLTHDWRRALSLALFVGGVGGVLFLLLNTLTGGGFYFNIVTANVNEFGMERLRWNLNRLCDAALILLYIGGASLLLIRRWNPLYALAAPYGIGAALSALTIGKIGSNVNYFLELCAALALASGIVVAWSRAHLSVHALRAALLLALIGQVGHLMRTTFNEYVGELKERRALTNELRELEALVAGAEAPVLADEHMGLATLQRQPLYIQPFEVTQLAWAGVWDQTPVLDSIRNKEFAYILIYDRPWANERWTQEMLAAINQTYVLADVLAENKVYRAFQRQAAPDRQACPGAAWQLPGNAALGVQWKDSGLDFFGQGNAGQVPVRAVADGLLTRLPGRVDAVAIQHADPLRPGEKVWSYYDDMGAANGIDSYVAPEFPPGAANIPVQAGQLLGYQGAWSGRPFWPMWMHVHFAVVRAAAQGAFPKELTPEDMLDPSPYLSVALDAANEYSQPLKCESP